jgi:carbohydrate diacid regulator
LLVDGSGEDIYTIGKMAAFQIQNLLTAYKERFDKDNFIKNLLLDNLLLIDIYSRSRKLHIPSEVKRVVMIVETAHANENNTLETVRTFFSGSNNDFVTAVDEKNVIIVKDLSENDSPKSIDKSAKAIESHLKRAGLSGILISHGTVVNELKEVSRSYKEAKLAMDVGKIFYNGTSIIAYNHLGIGRLIYQLPMPLCKIFIREIFDGKNPSNLDEETLDTIAKFFENSLNVSETARQLFIHRNTLVYRLDKLQNTTGLDLRVFEDAITFRIATMVVQYMKYMESLEF